MTTTSKGRTTKVDKEVLALSKKQQKILEEFFLPFNIQLCEIIGPNLSFLKDLC